VTYSLLARDAATGELAVGVQSHWFSVGGVVPWARPGVGVVATQSVAEPAYGPALLERLAAGETPEAALRAELAADEAAGFRQVAVLGAAGAPVVHTGAGCMAVAGHASAPDACAQANIMARDGVPEAMLDAFGTTGGPLAARVLAALQAAEAAGGDLRGRQSAALVVVPAAGEPWHRTVDLRVEDHADPLGELARLLRLSAAYAAASDGDELAGRGDVDGAAAAYGRAEALAPEMSELRFWAALARAQGGDVAGGAAVVRELAAAHAGWRVLLDRLPDELAPGAAAVREHLDG
jgi:uncharacterized Ntn-hydrolase superfamily protein